MFHCSRRTFLSQALCALSAATLPRGLGAQSAARPNIIVILADDMGFGDLACQNPESKIPTPHLDRLASEGMRFTDAHSPSAVCTPTRYGLLTGRYAWRTELKQAVLWPWDGPLLDDKVPTLPGMLREAGYSTACIGKWHLGWDWPTTDGSSINDTVPKGESMRGARDSFHEKVDFTQPIGGGPTAHGFDYYFGDDVPNFAPYCYIENNRVTEIPTVPKPEEMFGTPGPKVEGWDLRDVMPRITDKAVAYIQSEGGQTRFGKKPDAPFFLYFSLTAPHTPIAPSDEFIGKSGAHRYGDWVHQVDWTVGQVMRALEETGQAENTLVLFTSDNGSPARDGEDMSGAVGSVLEYGHNPSGIFRGIKADIWEGGHRVPFLVRWPGQIPAGTVSDALVDITDLKATFAAASGATLRAGASIDGFNQLAAFTDPGAPSARAALVHHSIDGAFALRVDRWKFIDHPGSGGWSPFDEENAPTGQLYDMDSDPSESRNLHEDMPGLVAELAKRLRVIQEHEGPRSRAALARD